MDGLTERQKMILFIEHAIKDIDKACSMIENGRKRDEAIGVLHSLYSRLEYRRDELMKEEANDAAIEQEKANAAAIFRT